jgi:hypothetical protein
MQRLISISIVAFCFTLGGCHLIEGRKSQLDDLRLAALKIQSRIITGVNRVEYAGVISDLAYQILLAKEKVLDEADSKALAAYSEVLATYMAAKDVWEESEKFKECMRSFRGDSRFCDNLHGSDLTAAARKAGISNDSAHGDSAVQTVWQIAEQKTDAAEKIRHSGK